MTLNFYVRFYTRFGEALYVTGTGKTLGDGGPILLQYYNDEFWHGQIELEDADLQLPQIQYNYIFKDASGFEILEWGDDRIINLQNKEEQLTLIDTWNHAGQTGNAFYTKPFQEVLLKNPVSNNSSTPKTYTHEFKVKAPL